MTITLQIDDWNVDAFADAVARRIKLAKDVAGLPPIPARDQVTPRLLSKKGAASYSGVSLRTVEYWLSKKLVAVRKIGGRVLVEKDSLDAFIDLAARTPAKYEV